MTIIRLCGQQLKLSAPVIAADTIDYIEMAVDMSEDWQRMDAVFVRFELDNYYVEAQVRDGKIRKEQHLNLTRGAWRVSAYGVRSSGEDIIERITSTTATLDVKVTGAHGGEPLPPDSQGVIEALKAQIAAKLDKRLDAEDAGKVLTVGEFGAIVPAELPVDDALDETSPNPVANKAVYAKLTEIKEKAQTANNSAGAAAIRAQNAYNLAENALNAASSAQTDAQAAQDKVGLASAAATSASTTASQAKAAASVAQTKANLAYDLARAKYTMPDGGIPESDFSADAQVKLNSAGSSVTDEHIREVAETESIKASIADLEEQIGDLPIGGSTGWSKSQIALLKTILQNALFATDQSININDLCESLENRAETPSDPDIPIDPPSSDVTVSVSGDTITVAGYTASTVNQSGTMLNVI